MVAYSFKRRFVRPIQVGLGMVEPVSESGPIAPKRQTIREHRKRHAYAGEEVQLYCAQRTIHCFLIGRARCIETQGISIHFRNRSRSDWLRCARYGKVDRPDALDVFAKADGFHDWQQLRDFWRENHPGVDDFHGIIIFWEPIK